MTVSSRRSMKIVGSLILLIAVGALVFFIHAHRQRVLEEAGPIPTATSAATNTIKGQTATYEAGKRYSRSLTVGGLKRNYTLFMPRTETKDGMPHPILFAFHPAVAAVTFMEENAPFHLASGTESFAVVYPEGIGRTFNAGGCCGTALSKNVDDVAFFKAMMADVAKVIPVRPQAYVTGFSNGSMMTYRLICDVPELIEAAVPYAGAIAMDKCVSGHQIPILHINGEADVFTMTGKSSSETPEYLNAINVVVTPYTALDQIATRNGCTLTRKPTTGLPSMDASCEAYVGCAKAAPVTMCLIPNLGHAWPGSGQNVIDGTAKNTKFSIKMAPYRPELDSTGPIVEFFLKH
jgi:polyhydroxybutyrate depolymerase